MTDTQQQDGYNEHDSCVDSIKLPVLMPYNRFAFYWNCFLFMILVYSIVEIPYSIAFGVHPSIDDPVTILCLLIDLCLLLDILLKFRTAYVDKYDRLRIITDPKLIAKKYLSTWFIVDFISSFPFVFIIAASSSSTQDIERMYYLRLLRLTKLVRIVKVLKMFSLFQQRTFHLNVRTIIELTKIICFMLLTAHYLGCFWYVIGHYAYKNGSNSWIDEIVLLHDGDENIANFTMYSYSFYWAIVTLFTTGYGDIHARNIMESWTASLGILIGSCFFAYFIGVLTTFLGEDLQHKFLQERIEETLRFCSHYNLPKQLRRAVLTHIRYYCNYNFLFDQQHIMNSLPTYLKKDIEKYLATSILNQLDIFENLPISIVGQIALKMKSKSFGEQRKVFDYDDIGKEIFIQRTGESMIFYRDTPKLNRKLKRGDVCGEDVIISRKRTNSVVCSTWSEFYVLNVNDIVDVLKINFDPLTAKNEWLKIKEIIRSPMILKPIDVEHGVKSPIISKPIDVEDVEHREHREHRHVRFETHKNFQEYLEKYRDIKDDIRGGIFGKTYETNLILEAEQEEKKEMDKPKFPRFTSIQNMFLNRDRSDSRHKKVLKHSKRSSLSLYNIDMDDVMENLMDNDDDDVNVTMSDGSGFFDRDKYTFNGDKKNDHQMELTEMKDDTERDKKP